MKFAFDFGKVSMKIKQLPHTNQYNQMNSELLLSAQTHGNDPKAQNRPQKRAWLVRRKRVAISQSLVLYNKFWKVENVVPWVQKGADENKGSASTCFGNWSSLAEQMCISPKSDGNKSSQAFCIKK